LSPATPAAEAARPRTSPPLDTVVVQGLSKSFGAVRALRALTVAFPAGAVGLLGPNGAGKSTLLKILLGLLPADDGSAAVLGTDVADDPLEVRRHVGYMPEVDAYVAGLTGAESVVFCGVLCGLPRRSAEQRAHEILYYVGLAESRYRRVEQYSTGMRQRLRLAQALVHDPGLIFLDEPTNGLDPEGRDEVLALIEDLTTSHGKSIVLCSHLLHDVEAVCEHVVVLRDGRIALQGAVEDVRRLERGTYHVRVAGDRDAFRAAAGRGGLLVVGDDQDALSVRVPEGAGAREIFVAAHAAGCAVRGLSTVEQSLEGVFIRAVSDS
jgi:ABC-2 type transport system ATP-binding protein